MRNRLLIGSALLATTMTGLADRRMTVGDGRIDGHMLEPYRFTWRQCSVQDGQWQDQGALVEELVVIGEHVLRHRQTVRQPGGVVTRSDTYFDRSSLAPLRMETEASSDGARLAYAERVLGEDGYVGSASRGDETSGLSGIISSTMLHGGALGLPLATMAYQDEPIGFPASMAGFDATYDVVAEWVGREMLQSEGGPVEAWLIDVEWRHRESGDVYPPGPDASGGRYWVVSDPPEGFPYVPRYKTDSYAVEFVDGVCPSGPSDRE